MLKEVKYLQEEVKREKSTQAVYMCPECGKPFENVSATESHLNDTYEVHLKASHEHPHGDARAKI
jgi:hypothetical protein